LKVEAIPDASPDGHSQRSFSFTDQTAIEPELLAPFEATDAHGRGQAPSSFSGVRQYSLLLGVRQRSSRALYSVLSKPPQRQFSVSAKWPISKSNSRRSNLFWRAFLVFPIPLAPTPSGACLLFSSLFFSLPHTQALLAAIFFSRPGPPAVAKGGMSRRCSAALSFDWLR
jgi:hypothetical protein